MRIYDKIHSKLEQKALAKQVGNPTYFVDRFVSAYSVFVAKCYKINDFFPNGPPLADFFADFTFFRLNLQTFLFQLTVYLSRSVTT